MATACANADDFDTDPGGALILNPHAYRSSAVSFTHALAGAVGVFEEITEIPEFVVPVAGLWVVTWDVRAQISYPASAAASVAANVYCALYKNDVIVTGSETTCGINGQSATPTSQPARQLQATGSGSEVLDLLVNDRMSIYAARAGDAGITTDVNSGNTGRSRIRAWRLGPS